MKKYSIALVFRLSIAHLFLLSVLLFGGCKKESQLPEDYCQCVGYVKNELGIPQTTPTAHAYAWDLSILPDGFYAVFEPEPGDIMVMGKGYNGASSDYGHIGIVSFVEANPDAFTIIIQGANHKQPNEFEQCGCVNVSFWEKVVELSDIENGRAKFFRSDEMHYRCFEP